MKKNFNQLKNLLTHIEMLKGIFTTLYLNFFIFSVNWILGIKAETLLDSVKNKKTLTYSR